MRGRVAVALALTVGALVVAACGGSDDETTPGTKAEPSASVPSAGAPIPGGGLSVQEAIDSTLEGPLMVKGFVVADGSGSVQLCTTLAESFPPQCGDPSLEIEGLDLATVEGLQRDEADSGRAWTDTEVSVLGDLEDGAIVVSDTSI